METPTKLCVLQHRCRQYLTTRCRHLNTHQHHLDQSTRSYHGDDLVDLSDAEKLFESVSSPKLIRSSLNLQMAAIEPLVDLGTSILKSDQTPLVLRTLVTTFIKHTLFHHFVAGQTPQDAALTAHRMWTRERLRGMLVYGLEHTHHNHACDRNLQAFLNTVQSAKSLPPQSVSFVIVKITAICPMGILERASHLLRWQHKNPCFHLPWKLHTLPIFSDASPTYHTLTQPQPLTPQEEADLQLGLERLHTLCRACLEANVPLSIDAEDTLVQPAIDYFTYSSAITFNKQHNDNNNNPPFIFGTMQAYLKDAKDRLALVTKAAQKAGVPLGFKLVRGAYMSSETALATCLGFDSPIHNTIQETHDCYNDCAHLMLDNISNGWGGLVLATHNVESGKKAARLAKDLGIKEADEKLQFAQLYGMSDALSFGLRNAGFIVSKYMAFGPIDLVIPFLLRRAEENKGVLSSSTLDRILMRKELKRRFMSSIT